MVQAEGQVIQKSGKYAVRLEYDQGVCWHGGGVGDVGAGSQR